MKQENHILRRFLFFYLMMLIIIRFSRFCERYSNFDTMALDEEESEKIINVLDISLLSMLETDHHILTFSHPHPQKVEYLKQTLSGSLC